MFCIFSARGHSLLVDARRIFAADRVLESLVPPDVDKEAFLLLVSLLDMNTRHRLTAEQALEHAFLGDCPRLPTAAADSSIALMDEDDAPDFR